MLVMLFHFRELNLNDLQPVSLRHTLRHAHTHTTTDSPPQHTHTLTHTHTESIHSTKQHEMNKSMPRPPCEFHTIQNIDEVAHGVRFPVYPMRPMPVQIPWVWLLRGLRDGRVVLRTVYPLHLLMGGLTYSRERGRSLIVMMNRSAAVLHPTRAPGVV